MSFDQTKPRHLPFFFEQGKHGKIEDRQEQGQDCMLEPMWNDSKESAYKTINTNS